MTHFTQFDSTISQEIEPIPPCSLSRKSGFATFSTVSEGLPLGRPSQLVEKAIFDFYASCGSTHSIEFALQIHKFREHGPGHPLLPLCGNSPCVSRNLYKGRKNVPVGRGFSSVFARKRGFEREAVRKTKFFDSLRGTPFGVPHFIFRRYSFCRR